MWFGCADISISECNKSSLELFTKNLFPLENADNANIKTFGWTVFHGTALPKNETGREFCHILHCPGQSSPFAQLCFFLWISSMEQRSLLHARTQNYSCLPFSSHCLKKTNQFRYSCPPSDFITTSSCAVWEHQHNSPPCPMCSREFCVPGYKQKSCWPGEFHRDGPKSCFSVIKKLKGIFSQFSNNTNV